MPNVPEATNRVSGETPDLDCDNGDVFHLRDGTHEGTETDADVPASTAPRTFTIWQGSNDDFINRLIESRIAKRLKRYTESE